MGSGMIRFVARRVAQSAGIMFLVSTLLFVLLLYFEPGGPCSAISSSCSASQLGVPAVDQYLDWLGGVLHGNFGTMASSNGSTTIPVTSYILQRLPATILLVAVSFPLQQLIALPLGIFAAVRRYSVLDQVFTVFSYVGLSMPAFVLGIILIYVFPVQLGIFAAGRTSNVTLPLF